MYSDSHIHTEFSGDSETPVTKQIEAAISLGMEELCITDHHDYDTDAGDIDFNLDTEQYLVALLQYQERYQDRIKLHIGVEFGQQPHLADYEEDYFSRYRFDFVIGSTHFINGKDPYYPDFFADRTEQEAYTAYFQTVAENVRIFQHYDVAGHLDYIVRYGPNQNRCFELRAFQDYIDDALKTIITKGKGIECNTAGLRHGLKQPNPHLDILKRYRELGGEILTLGSDAHISRDLGYDFQVIGELLKHCGFQYYTTFAKRKPFFHKL